MNRSSHTAVTPRSQHTWNSRTRQQAVKEVIDAYDTSSQYSVGGLVPRKLAANLVMKLILDKESLSVLDAVQPYYPEDILPPLGSSQTQRKTIQLLFTLMLFRILPTSKSTLLMVRSPPERFPNVRMASANH